MIGLRWFILFLIGIFISCDSNKHYVDLSGVELNITVDRFEADLFQINLESIEAEINSLKEKYPNFFPLFTGNIINIGGVENPSLGIGIKGFVTDQSINEVTEKCNENFEDFSDIEHEIAEAFKHYKFYFWDKTIPRVITFISGFNYAIVAADSVLGIGLDMYLGANCKYYEMLGYPGYKSANMHKEAIVPDCMRGWLTTEYVLDESKKDLLSQMIYQGKILYLLDVLLPEVDDTLKIGYTQKQLVWCENNASKIWAFMVDNKMLYTTDHKEIIKFIGEGPFTTGFPKESPARTGWWLGWQIVRSYMDNNEDVTPEKLMTMNDAQSILTDSNYKPRR